MADAVNDDTLAALEAAEVARRRELPGAGSYTSAAERACALSAYAAAVRATERHRALMDAEAKVREVWYDEVSPYDVASAIAAMRSASEAACRTR